MLLLAVWKLLPTTTAYPASMDECAQNLKALRIAAWKYERQTGRFPNDTTDLKPYIESAETIRCPTGAEYTWTSRDPHAPKPLIICRNHHSVIKHLGGLRETTIPMEIRLYPDGHTKSIARD